MSTRRLGLAAGMLTLLAIVSAVLTMRQSAHSQALGEQIAGSIDISVTEPPGMPKSAQRPYFVRSVTSQDTALALQVKRLLRRGANPNTQWNMTGETLLGRAAWYSAPATAAVLLDSGADPNKPDRNGYTPLMCAAKAGHPTMVALLIRRGADVGARRPDGSTALDLARKALNEQPILDKTYRADYQSVANLLQKAARHN